MGIPQLSDGLISMCFDPSLNFIEGKGSMIIEAQYIPNVANPVTADRPMEITSVRYVDALFTAGTPLAESLKLAFSACGTASKIYALPRLDAAGAVKAVYTMAFAGPATSDGYVDIFLGDKPYSVEGIVVNNGDTAATVATAVAAKIPASFPYVVTDDAAGTLTFTARNGGTIGNYLNPIYNWKNRLNYAPAGIAITVTRTTAGSVNPAPINYSDALGVCCYDSYILLTDDRTWQFGLRDWIKDSWDCTKPQCFGHGYTYNTGTLGTVLLTGSNSAELSRLAYPVNDPNFPWALTAVHGALSACSAANDPWLSIQGMTNGSLSPIWRPASCTTPWTFAEMTKLQEAGFVTFGPIAQGVGTVTNPYIHNDITNYLYDDLGRVNLTWRDANSRRLDKVIAVAMATKLQTYSGTAYYTTNTRLENNRFGTTKNLLTADLHNWAKDHVGTYFSEFDDLNTQLVVKNDSEVAAVCQGIPCKLHVYFQFRRPCRLAKFQVNAQPKMLESCNR